MGGMVFYCSFRAHVWHNYTGSFTSPPPTINGRNWSWTKTLNPKHRSQHGRTRSRLRCLQRNRPALRSRDGRSCIECVRIERWYCWCFESPWLYDSNHTKRRLESAVLYTMVRHASSRKTHTLLKPEKVPTPTEHIPVFSGCRTPRQHMGTVFSVS